MQEKKILQHISFEKTFLFVKILTLQWGVIMDFRVFSIRRDGSYKEVPAKKESFLDENGAYLIMDRNERKIYIYRKDGISSVLSYSAGRAATNLKTLKGSRYNIVNIEHEERDRIFPELLRRMESGAFEQLPHSSREYLPTKAYVYGEKTLPITRTVENRSSIDSESREIESKIIDVKKPEEHNLKTNSYDIENIVKTLASKILFESNVENLRNLEKPPRYELKSELVKKIDELLDKMYD